MIDLTKIANQEYLLERLTRLDRSDSPILDISRYSDDEKKKILAVYNMMQFRSIANKTPVRLSLLTEKLKKKKKDD